MPPGRQVDGGGARGRAGRPAQRGTTEHLLDGPFDLGRQPCVIDEDARAEATGDSDGAGGVQDSAQVIGALQPHLRHPDGQVGGKTAHGVDRAGAAVAQEVDVQPAPGGRRDCGIPLGIDGHGRAGAVVAGHRHRGGPGSGEIGVEQELQPGHRASLREVESQSRARIGVAGHPPGAQVGVGDCRRPRSRALDAATAGRGGDPAREVQQSFDIAPHTGQDGAGQFVCRSGRKRQRPEDAGSLLTGSHEGGRAQGPGRDEGAPGQAGTSTRLRIWAGAAGAAAGMTSSGTG